jgi:DNA mismatch endonuclease (patch repair protein)
MPERLSKEQRSKNMAGVKGRDTAPELLARRVLHGMGYRFRIHVAGLPGRPDIVLPRHRKIVQVHGCFWHGHQGCPRSKRPATNREFWDSKLSANVRRDQRNLRKLRNLGWNVMIVWECRTKNLQSLEARLRRFMERKNS